MSRSSRKAVTAAIVAHGDSELARLRERVRVLTEPLKMWESHASINPSTFRNRRGEWCPLVEMTRKALTS